MMRFIIILILMFNSFPILGQTTRIDSLKLALENSQDTTKANINVLLSMEYHSKNVHLAEQYAKEGLALSSETNYKKGIADALRELGRIEVQKGSYANALEYYLKSLDIYETVPNALQIAYANNDIGNIYGQMNDHGKALEYFNIALAQFEKIPDHEGIADALNNIGVVYDLQNKFEKAIIYYEKALEWYKKNNEKQKYANTIINIGTLNGIMGNYELGINTIKEAQKTYVAIEDYYGLTASWVNLSKIYGNSGDYKQATEAGLEGLALAQKNEYNRWIIQSCKYLASNHAALKDYEKAFQYSQLLAEAKENAYNDQKTRVMTEMEIKYQTEKKEQEIIALGQQKQTAEFRRTTYLVAGILVALILLLLYNQQRQKSKKNRLLFQKEHEVAIMKSNFFANISHEFRTPLTLILGPIQILKTSIKNPKMNFHLEAMERNANRLLSLINQLLDLAEIESGSQKLELSESDIVSVVKGVTMSFQSKAAVKQIQLKVETGLDQLSFYFDREKVETILINLLTNSFNFTPDKGKIKVSLEVVQGIHHKKQCKIVVKDNGSGIPNEDIDTIFNRFYQSSNHQDEQYDGSGIGLALTKELVELHKGSIAATSSKGEGTEITVLLPVGKAHFSKEELAKMLDKEPSKANDAIVSTNEQRDHTPTNVKVASSPILLLIEDNADVMQYVKEILGDTYQVLEAIEGEMGINLATDSIPDLIISDVMMPKKNGYEVCDTLKKDERTSHIPIILLTAKASLDDKMQGLQTKADAYLTKPFVPKELLVRVQNLIESRKQLREKYHRELILKPSEISVNSIDEVFLKKVMKVVDENLDDENFNMDKLGQNVGMSRSQIHRKLHALTNQSATQFIRSYRLDRAMDLIKKNAGSVSEIAYSVGFSDPSYFSKCFHEQFNITPSEAKNSLS